MNQNSGEFINEDWLNHLIVKKIQLYVPIRNNMMIHRKEDAPIMASWQFNNLKSGTFRHCNNMVPRQKHCLSLWI